MLTTLGITTSTEQSGVALMKDGGLLGEEKFSGARSCVEELVPQIQKLLESNALTLRDLNLIAVDLGPGGMTGLKIGVVTARTLGQSAGIKLAGASSTKALCMGVDPQPGTYLLTVIKCIKKEFFSALYKKVSDEETICICEEKLVDSAGLAERIKVAEPGKLLVLGDAAEHVRDIVTRHAPDAKFAHSASNYPSAANICRLAELETPVFFNEIIPNYLCLSNAERTFGITV